MASKTSNIRKPSTAEERDELLGRELSKRMNAEVPTICPTAEDIAAIIDGGITGEARDRIMVHLAGCERCHDIFVTSQELMEEETAPIKRMRFGHVTGAIAAVAVLVMVITITLRTGGPEKATTMTARNGPLSPPVQTQTAAPVVVERTPSIAGESAHSPVLPSATDVARLLVREDDAGQLTEAIKADSVPVYGFSGVLSAEKIAFRLGVHAADIEVLLRSGDREAAVVQVKQVVELLRQRRNGQVLTDRLATIMGRMEAGESLHRFSGCTVELDKVFSVKDERFLYRFGIWAEGGRLASSAGNRDFVTVQALRYVQDGVKGMQLPLGVRNALGEIEVALGNVEVSESKLLRMKRAFEDIVGMF